MNIALAKKVLESLAALGVQDILLCAGARNSPLVMLLEKSKGFRLLSFFEERSAGFFALGRAQRDGKPVAVITTSGTAVAELLPAAVEATYTQTPLIFVTADRPRNYRGTGAPQSIDQVGIFSRYVETCVDIASVDEEMDLFLWTRTSPLQINVCFDEPLIDQGIEPIDFFQVPVSAWAQPKLVPPKVKSIQQPLVIAGPMSCEEAEKLVPQLQRLGAPIYAEALSNLRRQPGVESLLLKSGEKIVRDIFIKGWATGVVRIGGVPTLRFWRDLEEVFKQVPVISFASTEFTGLSRPSQHAVGLENFELLKAEWPKDSRREIFSLDLAKQSQLQQLIQKYPQSEVSLIAALGAKVSGQFLYLGNSLPIREWDLVCDFANSPFRQVGNRGANGIDGQLSSFLGGASASHENWCLVGDLTALYDLSALWITSQLEDWTLRLVVVNNQGGQIFKNMFEKDIFLNRHQIGFQDWARMWNWHFEKWHQVPKELKIPRTAVIELVPDAEQSHSFWQEYKTL